ncbi:MAG: hypothetical protein JF615_11930 [Asticcacaulis sp.]|nr:hypothetical protein [Asticcacaulis sp.]
MNLQRRLGVSALCCGLAAPLAGSPYRKRAFDPMQTAQLIIDGGDHVSALQLATWIRDRKPGLRVIDVRTPREFAEFAIPTAENLPLDVLLRTRFTAQQTLVLYSEGGAHAGQAWTLLRAIGVDNAFFIAGGLADWRDEVMAPSLKREDTQAAELSRYFGGSPTIGAVPNTPRLRRRGC